MHALACHWSCSMGGTNFWSLLDCVGWGRRRQLLESVINRGLQVYCSQHVCPLRQGQNERRLTVATRSFVDVCRYIECVAARWRQS